jgi:hypothetical protein
MHVRFTRDGYIDSQILDEPYQRIQYKCLDDDHIQIGEKDKWELKISSDKLEFINSIESTVFVVKTYLREPEPQVSLARLNILGQWQIVIEGQP